MHWLGRWYDLVTSFAAVLYVGRYKVVAAKRTYLHVLLHSTANPAEDARGNSPVTGGDQAFKISLISSVTNPIGHRKSKRVDAILVQIPRPMKASRIVWAADLLMQGICVFGNHVRRAGVSLDESRSDPYKRSEKTWVPDLILISQLVSPFWASVS